MSTAAEPRRSSALGAWALGCAVLAPVWLFAGLYLVIGAIPQEAPVVVVVLANILAWGWFVVPLAVIAALVLGILAIVLKRGKPLGIAALVLLLLGAVGVVLYLGAAFAAFNS